MIRDMRENSVLIRDIQWLIEGLVLTFNLV